MSSCSFIRELSLNHICDFKSFCPIRFVTFFLQKNFKREKSSRPGTERMIILWSIKKEL